MTVTAVAPVNKQKSRVFVDEGFSFVLYNGEIARLKIEEGMELTDALYARIETDILNRRARERSVDLLKASDKSEAQIRRRLTEDGFPEPVVERTVALLKKHRYLNDQAFAGRYVEYQSASKSRRQIEWELRGKGVDGETVREALREALPEEDLIRRLVKKRAGTTEGLTREQLYQLYTYLGRKGFSYEAIRRVLGEPCAEE